MWHGGNVTKCSFLWMQILHGWPKIPMKILGG